MENEFYIQFNYPLEGSHPLAVNARVEVHPTATCYIVHSFNLSSSQRQQEHDYSLLPKQLIKRILANGEYIWVHQDSERASVLSTLLGEAIEKQSGKVGG